MRKENRKTGRERKINRKNVSRKTRKEAEDKTKKEKNKQMEEEKEEIMSLERGYEKVRKDRKKERGRTKI